VTEDPHLWARTLLDLHQPRLPPNGGAAVRTTPSSGHNSLGFDVLDPPA
jgi:hypothetical protein